jgi:AraC-like DNA-binding protein
VERNYADPITLKEAASLAKMSVPQFVRLFRKVAGMSFVSYLTHVRLSRSVRLLKESCLTIAEVAYWVGFSDQSYFDRRFKAAFGQTPRDFRLLREEVNGSTKGLMRPFRRIRALTELASQEALFLPSLLKDNQGRRRLGSMRMLTIACQRSFYCVQKSR